MIHGTKDLGASASSIDGPVSVRNAEPFRGHGIPSRAAEKYVGGGIPQTTLESEIKVAEARIDSLASAMHALNDRLESVTLPIPLEVAAAAGTEMSAAPAVARLQSINQRLRLLEISINELRDRVVV